jgi:filamentous hemagglutinin family protein
MMTMNRTGSKILHGLLLATSGLVGSTIIASTAAMAGGPTGGHVAVGSATIVNASPTQTVINQSSKKALINWNSFSVSSGSSVQFNQPNSKSLTVNRVTGADASVINGTLQANGNVWLLNANGVLFGKGSQVNVGSLLATTSDISDDDFKNGNYTFKPSANGNASVVNKGTIAVSQGSSVVLSAPQVSNEGVIQANLGTVVLGGAKAFTVDMTGDNLLTYQITEPVSDAPKSANGSVANALVSNSGTIMAAGGHVLMTARAARNVEDSVINNTGMVEATTVSSHNGVIDLDAGPDGTVNAGGTLDVSGTQGGQTGGTITATGGMVNVADGAKLNASGDAGGGTVLIGGDAHGQGTLAHAQRTVIGRATITADATTKGDGGKVVVWSDGDTSFDGSISARGGVKGGNGGFVETSGHNLGVTANATVNTLAPVGLSGDWLLDPVNITIGSCGSTSYDPNQSGDESIAKTAITNGLASGNMILEATSNITLDTGASINYAGSNTLSLLAEGNITLGSDIQFSGSGAINLVAGWDGQTTDLSSLGGSVYGNNGGSITIGDSAHIGSASGKTTLAGDNLFVGSTNKAIQAQIGYNGEGSGDIAIRLTGDLTVNFGTYSSTFQIGNYNPNGNASGDVNIAVGGNAQITQANGTIVVGNTAPNGTVTGSLTFAAGSITEDHNVLENNIAADLPGGDVAINVTGSSLSFNGATYNSPHDLTLYSNGDLTINSAIQNTGTGGINLSSYSDGLTINAPVSTLGSVAIDTLTAGASITLNSDIVAGGSLGLNACGSIVQSGGSIQASDLNVTTTGAGHSITLGSVGNEISGTIVLSTPSDAAIANGQTTTLGAITVGGLLNVSVTDPNQGNGHSSLMLTDAVDVSGSGDTVIHATGDIINLHGQSLITADALNLISDYGSIGAPEPNDPNTSFFILASINSLHAQTGGGGGLLFSSSKAYSVGTDLGGIDTGAGTAFIAASAGAITQSKAIVAGDFGVSTGSAGFILSNPGNDISGRLSLYTTGTGLFASSSDISLRNISGSGFDSNLSSAGKLTVETSGNLTVVSGGTFNLSGDISLLASDNLTIAAPVQNSGAGNITLVAGWDGVSTTPALLVGSGAYGSGNQSNGSGSQGNVTISGNDNNVSVGSAGGSVLVEGFNVAVRADQGGGYAQIGYNGASTGNIVVNAQNDVMLYASDDDDGCGACYAQIGNGGYDVSANASGNVTINAGNYVSLNGGAGEEQYAQIGNGGYRFDGQLGGIVSVQSGGDVTLTGSGGYAQIGNGGYSFDGTIVGDIFINANGSVTLTGGEGYAQIGNGGAEANGTISGDIWVTAGISASSEDDDIELSAGSGDYGYAQIGNGGDNSSSTNSGNITVSTTGAISLTSNSDYAQIGNGGWGSTGGNGDIKVHADQDLTINAYGVYAQIGNGGSGENAHGGTGDVTVTSNGSILLDGSGYGAYAKIGNGGDSTTDDADGGITVSAVGNLTLTGGEGSSQIGNGGFGFEGNVSGDIAITVGGETIINQSGWIGNYTDTADWTASGNVSIVTGTGDISGQFLETDLQNGDLLLGWTDEDHELNGLTYNSSHNLTLYSYGDLTITSAVQNAGTGGINLSSYSGSLTINAPVSTLGSGAIDTFASGGSITLNSSINVGADSLGLQASGSIVQSNGSIQASVLNVATTGAGHSITLGSVGNEISGAIFLSTPSDATIANGQTTTLGAITVGGLLNVSITDSIQGAGHSALILAGLVNVGGSGDTVIHATGDIINLHGQSLITADALNLISDYGSIGAPEPTDPNTSYFISASINSLHAKTGSGGDLLFSSSKSYSIGTDLGGIDTGGGYAFIAASTGAITQSASGAIVTGDLDVSVGEGGFVLSNPGNDISGSLSLNTTGTGLFASSSDIRLNGISGSGFINDSSSAGNVTVETQGNLTVVSGGTFNLSGDVSLLAAQNLEIDTSLQNPAAGNITLVAGWDGHTTDLSSLTSSGGYGNGDSTVTIGGLNANGTVAVGSKSGATNILTDNLLVSAENGNAQLGYSGQGSGNINVYATGDITVQSKTGSAIALIGNGGAAASGLIGGDINITTQSGAITVESAVDNSLAMIGNLGGDGSSQSGNTTINTHGGALTLVADNPGKNNVGYAHIGSLTYGSTTETSSGDITINAGAMSVEATGEASFADIGNGSFHIGSDTGALSGNITISATTLSLVSDASGGTAQARIGHLGMGSVSGDINIATTGALSLVGNNLGLSSIGSVSAPMDTYSNLVQGAGSGNINIQSGAVTLASQNGGHARIESGGFTSGNINVAATGNISLTANGSFAGIGAFQSGNGTVNVSVTSTGGGISLRASGTNGEAQIGNSANGAPGKIGGSLSVSAGNASNGNITVSASGNGSVALIGATGYGDTVTGDISVLAGNSVLVSGGAALTATPGGGVSGTLAQIGDTNVSLWNAAVSGSYSGNVVITAQSLDGIGSSVFNDLVGGDVTVNSLGSGTLEIDDTQGYSSAHDFLLNAGGDVLLESSLQNSGSGNLTFVSAGNVTIGGSGASGSASLGSQSGSTSVTAKNLVISAVHGNAQLGYAGAGTGAIQVNTAGDVTVQTASNNTVALIGNGGYGLTGALKGDISVFAGGNVTVQTNSSSSIADIGVIGGDGSSQSGNITIAAGGQVGVIAQNATSSAQIGNQQAGATTPSQRGDASGNIAITSGSVLISATGTNTGAVIGMGNSLLRNQNASGSISVNTGNLTISSSSTTSTGTVALLGARGYNSANSNITVTASGNVSLAAGNYGNALLGQGSYGTAAGDILVASGGTLSLNANGTASQARVGNSGVNANGNITVSATTATLANASGATSLIGGSATGGTLTGNVTVLAGTVQGIGASIANDIIGGDFTLYATNSGTLDVGSVGSYSSAHDLYIVSADNLSVSGSIQNAGTGDIILAAAHTITVGGANASGGVAVGSKSGTTEIEATDLLLSATNGYVQIGYHGGGSGAIDVIVLGNVTISGGGSTGYYAQIGDGGYNVAGSSSAPITVTATSNIALNGGAGQEAYAQIGNGGAESNSNTGGYSETGDIAVSNSGAMALNAGTGQGSYVQIGNGGYLSGQSLNGTVTIGGNISVTTYAALGLTGGGNDAYVQIGNGGDFLNKNVANGSSGTISGEIAVAVQAPNVPGQDQLKLTAGTGANSYTQIGNGGQGENKPVAGAKVNFTISGNVTVADLTLAGSNTGANGYAQIGNGDASRTGTGNVAGSVALGQGTNLTYIPGKAQGSSAGFGNATGTGTVSGTVASSGVSAGTQGSVAAITQTSTNPVTTSAFTTVTAAPTYVQQLASIDTVDNTQGPTPLEQLSDNSEQTTVSDTVADSVGKSLGEGKTIAVSSKMLIPGLLKQIVTLTPNQPHGVPPADVDYSSWGNEALWRW